MALQRDPQVSVEMRIHRPVAEVFEAFLDPAVTTRFWFTKSSGRVEPGATLTWEWEMYGVSVPVNVKAVEKDERILIEWGDPPAPVEWRFDDRGDNTVVRIAVGGFGGRDDAAVAAAIDSMGGFSMLLASAKAWLEHGIELTLVADAHPDAHVA